MATPPDNLDTWVLAGQSNMQGCGLLKCALGPDARVWNFSSAGQWEIATEPLHRLWESCTPVQQKLLHEGLGALTLVEPGLSDEQMAEREAQIRKTGAGLGIAFGKALADATGKPVGLISAAHGATKLEHWNANQKDEGGNSLYGAMLERIGKAGGTLRGVLWYQGESDSSPEAAPSYGARFESWVQSLRTDLNMPELPVIVVQLGRVLQAPPPLGVWDQTSWETVREAQRLLPETVPYTAATSAIDLGLCDNIHIDTAGLIRLGKRMARLACLFQNGGVASSPKLVRVEPGAPEPHGFGTLRVVCEGVAGSWNPKAHMSGFQIYTAEGAPRTDAWVIDASPCPIEPDVIDIIVNLPLDDSMRLAYGAGLNPYCNVVDKADQPLLAFAPQKISRISS